MSDSTIILIVVVASVAVLVPIALAFIARNKRTERRRRQAGEIREKAAEQAHEVGQREAHAEQIAAKSRAMRAESEALAAQAENLEHRPHQHRSDAATARSELDSEFQRADKIDPGAPASDTPPAR